MNFAERRKQVFEKMERQSVLILFSGIESHVSADEYAPFEADRNFFYLTGLRRDHMILLMKKTLKEEQVILFIEEADPTQERWYGRKVTVDEAKEIVLWMVDAVNAASQIEQLSEKIIPRCEGKHLIVVFNKADLIEDKQKENLLSLLKDFPKESTESIFISAKQRKNTSELQKMLIDAAHLPTVTQNDIIVTNVRHYEALNKALEAIHRVQNGLDSQISGDFLSQDIRECIFFISDIAGEVTNDMVLQNIFQHFCIGK